MSIGQTGIHNSHGCADNPVNIALGKSVKVSSLAEISGWLPEYLADGITDPSNFRKGWSSAFGITANMRGRNEWVEIDLGAIY